MTLMIGHQSLTIVNLYLYRPPQSTLSMFYSELADLLSAVVCTTDRILLCGDFNCPGRSAVTVDPDLSAVLSTFGLSQHVSAPTRNDNLLDVVATDTSLTVDTGQLQCC